MLLRTSLVKIVSATLFTLFLFPAIGSATQTLVYTDHEPLGGMRTRFINDVFFPAIEKESAGRLKIEAHWGSELAISYDALSAVGEKKVADMCTAVPEYTPNEMPLHQIFKGFPIGPTGDAQVAFFRRVYAEIPAFARELENANVVNIFSATGYPVAFFSTSSLDSLNNMKGQKWRTASFWHKDFMSNSGSTPVTMPWGDAVYNALRSKDMDGLMVNVDSGYLLNVHEVAPYVLVSKELWLGHLYPLVMNKQTWESLEQQDKDAVLRAAEIAYESLGAVMDRSFDVMIEDMRNAGATVRILDAEELNAWVNKARCREMQVAWAKELESKGLRDVVSILEQIQTLLTQSLNE